MPDRKDVLAATGLGVFSLLLYIRTLLPGLLPLDGGEFQTVAYTFDHAHTTGYSIYILLAKLFTLLIPVGDIAYRVNLFSAVMAALTVGLVYLIGRVMSGSRWGGAIGALALAISGTFWSQAIIAEVYSLGSAFTAGILLLVVYWYKGGSSRLLFAAGLLGGMAVGAHGSVLLLVPAVLFLLLTRIKNWRQIFLPSAVGAALGVLLLLVVFAAINIHTTNASILWSAYIPSVSRWDMTPDQLSSPVDRFVFLVFARQWRVAMFVDPASVMGQNAGRLLQTLTEDFSWPVLALVVLGLFILPMREKRLGWCIILAILAHLIYTLNYRIGDIYVFFISLYVYLMALAAYGTGMILHWITGRIGDGRPVARAVVGTILVVAIIIPFTPGRVDMLLAGEARWDFMQLSSNRDLEGWRAWVSGTVQHLPDDAVVLTDWYNLYGYIYAAQVEQNRPDMLFMEAYPYSTKPGIADSLLVFLREQIAQDRPVYSTYRIDELQRGGMRSVPVSVNGTTLFYIQLR